MRFSIATLIALLVLEAAAALLGTSNFFAATSDLVRVVGRTARKCQQDNCTTLYADWSSVYIEVSATGPLSILLAEEWAHGNEYSVSFNGTERFQLNTSQNSTEYGLLEAGMSATVRIEKVTEARRDAGGLVGFLGFKAGALHPPPQALKRRIECIGDSIMCGCHSERWSPYPSHCPTTRGTPEARESSRLSWCARVARALSADYQMQCESGNGLIMTDGDTCRSVGGSATCMPEKWHRRLSCARDDPKCAGLGGLDPLDDFSPDAVLINLGQNDYGKAPKHLPTTAEWTLHYTAFLGNISATYSKKPEFFLACGGMATKYCTDTQSAISSMRAAGIQNIHYLDLTAGGASKNETTMGCANHPSWVSHAAMAEIALPKVEAVIGDNSFDYFLYL